uniref:Uncharacterized protein n=1 Tax=viral metagenome TaxID=1070528 RepID=A0A6M3LV04_9ZZZZ
MIVKMEEIKFKELAAAVKILNDSKLLEKPIATVGTTKEAIVNDFIKAVQLIPDDEDGNWTGPVEVANYYTSILVVPPPEETKGKTKEEKAPKVPKVPGEKTENRPQMLVRKMAELGKSVSLEALYKDQELMEKFDGHKSWIKARFENLQGKK